MTDQMTDHATIDVTIYGASDDLIEFDSSDRSIYGEASHASGGDSHVVLTAPDFATLALTVGFCTFAPEWGIRIESHGGQTPSWPIRFVPRPDMQGDPAVIVTVPSGTTATCDGVPVR